MSKKIKIVVDANIFINSWFYTNHFYCDAVVDLINNDQVKLLFSQDTIGELIYVVKNIVLDLFDEMFLKTAIKGRADYIISDDFRSGMHRVKLEGTKIVSSEQFVSMYERLCVGGV